jgi:hypothetical protein
MGLYSNHGCNWAGVTKWNTVSLYEVVDDQYHIPPPVSYLLIDDSGDALLDDSGDNFVVLDK